MIRTSPVTRCAAIGLATVLLVAACSSSGSKPSPGSSGAGAGAGSGAGSASASASGLSTSEFVSAANDDMKKLKINASQLGDLASQLNIPQSWIDGAKKEGKVTIETDQHPDVTDPLKKAFEERYPYIKANFVYGSTSAFRSQALVAFKQGKNVADVIGGITATLRDFEQAGALVKLTDLPVWKDIPENSKDPAGYWIGYATKFWGIGYNTDKVKVSDLPKTWQDVTSNARMKQSDVGITDKPELYVYALAAKYGIPFAQDFSNQLFANGLQQRNEGQGALPQLIANGTVSMVLPTASYTVEKLADKGAPVSWYTPQPPASHPSDLDIMSNAKDPNAAKIFTNWEASSEGELVAAVAENVSPVNDAFKSVSALYPYADQVVGKDWINDDSSKEPGIMDAIDPIWDQHWAK